MDQALAQKITQLRADYATITGHPFSFFFCPMLFRDDNVELCKAHVVNQAFQNTPSIWTAQRKDIDNFYGSHFEAAFTHLQDLRGSSGTDLFSRVFADKTLYKKYTPKILLDGETIDHFIRGKHAPKGSTRVEIEQDEQLFSLGLKMPSEAVEAFANTGNWELEIAQDLRIPALVSLIKAAHLTMFHLFEYTYVCSDEGAFVGRHMLGDFFQQNIHEERADILANADAFFTPFIHMVRPVPHNKYNLQGTVNDRIMMVCHHDQGFWAHIVFVKTGTLLHAILLPIWDQYAMRVVYQDFLNNQAEQITASFCRFDHDHWTRGRKPVSLVWPKGGM